MPITLFSDDKDKIKQIVPRENSRYSNESRIIVEGIIDERTMRLLNATEITIQVPESLGLTIDDINGIRTIGKFSNLQHYSTDNRPFEITTKQLVFHCFCGSPNVRKLTGTPIHVSDFLLPFVFKYEAQKEEVEKRHEEEERERLEVTDRRLESAKSDTLAEIKGIRSKLDSLEKETIGAKEYSRIPDVYTYLYPDEDC